MSQQNTDFLSLVTNSVIEETATLIAKDYVVDKLIKNGSVTVEEADTIFAIATSILESGAEDLIPDNIEIDDTMLAGEDASEDLNYEELEGIILPDAEGNEYIIQGGVLVPYVEEEAAPATIADPTLPEEGASSETPAAAGEASSEKPVEESVQESTAAAAAAAADDSLSSIEESSTFGVSNSYATISSVVDQIIAKAKIK